MFYALSGGLHDGMTCWQTTKTGMSIDYSAESAPGIRPERVQLDRHTYEIVGVRSGGFGKVWLLHRPEGAQYGTIYEQWLAVKTFNADEESQEAEIEQELGNWISLNSPYVVTLIKVARLNFELGAMMQLMKGNLAEYLANHESLENPIVKTLMLDALHGLQDAYQQSKLVHLDLKPANLLLESIRPPRIKISDWGMARIMSQPERHAGWLSGAMAWLGGQHDEKTQFGGGTLAYMAPERLSGSWRVSPAADVFSLGMIGVQLVTGRLPFTDSHPGHCIASITSHEYFKHAKVLLGQTNSIFSSFILRMIHPDPARRPTDYTAIIVELESL
jgi:serine/threonine protein kinase